MGALMSTVAAGGTPSAHGRAIDGWAFARTGSQLAGADTGGSFPRAIESGAVIDRVTYVIDGRTRVNGKLILQLSVTGSAQMQCQRCMESVGVAIAIDTELELAVDQAAIDANDDDVDRVVGTNTMDVLELVEDEVLLALPMVARHSDCQPFEVGDVSESALAHALRARINS